ncbi:MAG: hypothetical protein FWG43_05615, partial [Clostridiales bacterium]|nr:hypothetical protein [Clostridiales bacterium]
MKKSHILFIALVIAMALIASSFTAALARDTMPTPLDPQNWQLHRDKTWDDIKPNPMINWLTEHNIQGIQRPSALRNSNDKTPIAGGLIMIEYLDRKFISRGDIGSDPLGYYLYKQDGSGLEDSKTNNPIYNVPQLVADEKYGGDISKVTDTDFANWWADYLNKPQKINHGLTINEAWRENSYGKWVINLTAYGPYTIPYFEFETMGYDQGSSFQTYRDQPPSFRRGSSGTSNGFSFDSVSATYVDSVAATGQFTWDNVDFFFWLHAGYDESGVWQEFGMNQFASRKDIPHELGPGLRMKKVEQFFTENPQWLSTYASRYNGGSNSSTTTRDFWAGELTKYNATQVVGYSGPAYEFHLSQADWDWVDGYNDQTQKNTRYVNFTSWEAAVGEWSHMSSISRNGRTIRYSTQGENDGMSAFAHEFGHIGGLGDNYGNPYTARVTAATEPWELMSRGAFSGPFGDHARWTVPGVEGSSVPVHYMTYNKIQSSYYD